MALADTTLNTRSEFGSRDDLPPHDSARAAIWIGGVILFLFFGGLGTWAVTAPLNAAVVGNAVVKVEGNRKSVQHLDGGIVQAVFVRDGDRVREGDPLMVLDGSQVKADYDVFAQQHAMLRATEARLTAELSGAAGVEFPADLTSRKATPYVATAISGQEKEFLNRRTVVEGQEQSARQRIAQLQEQIAGNEGQVKSYREQARSVIEERQSLNDLYTKGLVTKPRLLQLDRTAVSLEGQIAAAQAAIAQAKQAIGEQTNLLAQIRKDRLADISRDLRDVQAKLLDVGPRLKNAETQLSRLEVRAPYSGIVVALKVFSVGGVVGRGEKLLDIVPDQTRLSVEAQIKVEDISDVHPGMSAEVHFTSYKQRTVPLIHGRVATVSADRLTDERTGAPYYVVTVDVDPDELAASPQIKLYPGMPASVVITTEARTALDYILGPLVASFDAAFRQK